MLKLHFSLLFFFDEDGRDDEPVTCELHKAWESFKKINGLSHLSSLFSKHPLIFSHASVILL